MGRYVIKRLLLMIPVILGVTWLIFTIMYFTPGDPARIIMGADATEEEIWDMQEKLGLHQSYIVRFGNYLKQTFLKFDMGTSYINGRSVWEEISMRFPYTFICALISCLLSVVIGIPLGVFAAVNQFTWKDKAATTLTLFGVSIPNFWLALLLSIVFALKLGWLPPTGIGGPKYYILPCFSLSVGSIASLGRQTRSAMLEVIRQDYIVTARAKGQKERKVIYGHGLRNALIPVVTQVGGQFGFALGGAMICETCFAIPGIGTYMVSGIKNRDYPAVQGAVLYTSIIFSLMMLLVDLAYAFIDPRIRAQYQGQKKRKVEKKEEGGAAA